MTKFEFKILSTLSCNVSKSCNLEKTETEGLYKIVGALDKPLFFRFIYKNKADYHTVVDENIDPSLNLTLNKAQKREINVAMSNTFGFGGHNACVLFKKLEA